jgi:ribose transport system permease protein
MNKSKKVLNGIVYRLDIITVFVLTVCLVIFFLSNNAKFLTLNNMFNLLQFNAALIIVAVGMTFVVMSGNMDLSSGAIIVLTASIMGVIFRATDNMWLGIAACIVTATLIGAINGFLIAYLKINAVIITLSCMIWARGLALGITNAKSIVVSSPVLKAIYNTFAFNFVNISLLIVILCVAAGWFMMTRTKFGRYTKALGENERATELAGINTRFVKWKIFTFASLLTGIASVVDLARLGSAVVTIGDGMELNAIVAVVIGGNKLSGGEGSFGKTLAGLLFICILSNGLSTMGITDDLKYLLKGSIILGALVIQMLSNRFRINYLKKQS